MLLTAVDDTVDLKLRLLAKGKIFRGGNMFHLSTAVFCLLSLIGRTETSAGPQQKLSVDDVIERIQQQESHVGALFIRGFKGQAFSFNDSGVLEASPDAVEGDVLRDGMLDGRYMLDLRDRTKPIGSADGKKGQSISVAESYDGSESRRIRRPATRPFPPRRPGTAEISSGRLDSRAVTFEMLSDGTAATLGYFQAFLRVDGAKSPLLGDSLAAMRSQQLPLNVSLQIRDQETIVTIEDSFGNSYSFNQDRGFALIAAETAKGQSSIIPFKRLIIDKLVKLNEKDWFPVRGRWEGASVNQPGAREKIEFEIGSASLVEPRADNFRIVIPAGYSVHDLISNRAYTSTGSLTDIQAHLNSVSDKGVAAVGIIAQSNATSTMSGGSRYLVFFGFVCLIVLTFIYIRYRRRQAKSGVIIVFLAASLLSVASGRADERSASPRDTGVNCGLNVTYVAARLFDRTVTIDEVAKLLNAGDRFENECSIADIQSAVAYYDLTTEAIRVKNVAQFLATIPTNFVAIVRLRIDASPERFHFVVVAHGSSDVFACIDPFGSVETQSVSTTALTAALASQTGELLLIRDPIRSAGAVPKLSMPEVDIGMVTNVTAAQSVVFRLSNRGSEEVVIKTVRASCGCIGAPEFTPKVKPGDSATIRLRIDPRLLPPGRGTREVLIETNGVGNGVLIGTIAFELNNLQSSDAETKLALRPSSVTFGLRKLSDSTTSSLPITLLLGSDVSAYDDPVQVFVESSTTALIVNKVGTLRFTPAGLIEAPYEIAIRPGQSAGNIDAWVTFSIRNRRTSSYDHVRLKVTASLR